MLKICNLQMPGNGTLTSQMLFKLSYFLQLYLKTHFFLIAKLGHHILRIYIVIEKNAIPSFEYKRKCSLLCSFKHFPDIILNYEIILRSKSGGTYIPIQRVIGGSYVPIPKGTTLFFPNHHRT